MSNKDNVKELKHRVQARRKELEAKLHEKLADAHAGSSEAAEKIKKQLSELKEATKEGWDNLRDSTVDKLNQWLDRSR